MDRRTALKNLSISLGYTVAAPTIFNMLASCNADSETWVPIFLTDEEKYIITHLMDIILPKTDTPGALDINVPQFLDMMYYEIETLENQEIFKKGAGLFAKKFTSEFKKPVLDGKKRHFETILSNYFTLSPEDTELLLDEQKLKIEKVTPESIDKYALYKFLLSVKYYTVFGYCTSEKIGEEVLAYDPVPGVYKGCISVEEATNGKAWSL